MKYIFTICLLLGGLVASAQRDYRPGYIVTLKADTLKGWISYAASRLDEQRCFFKHTPDAEAARISAESVRAYGFYYDRIYETIRVRPDSNSPEVALFAWVLVRGQADLLLVKTQFFARKDGTVHALRWRVKEVMVGSRWVKMEDREYERMLSTYLLADCPYLNLTGSLIQYTQPALMRVFETYNRCQEKAISLPPSVKPGRKWEGTLLVGGTRAELGLLANGRSVIRLSSGIVPLIGGQLGFSAPWLSERISLQLGLFYQQFLMTATHEAVYSTSFDQEQYFLRAQSWQVPFLVRYTVPRQRFQPFVQIGASIRSNRTLRSYRVTSVETANVVVWGQDEVPDLNPTALSFIAGLGVRTDLTRRLPLTTEFRYERGGENALRWTTQFAANRPFSSLSILVGIGF